MVRSADDFVILAATSKEASRALREPRRRLPPRFVAHRKDANRRTRGTINFLGHTIATKGTPRGPQSERAAFIAVKPRPRHHTFNN